jgi:hypothetical protein
MCFFLCFCFFWLLWFLVVVSTNSNSNCISNRIGLRMDDKYIYICMYIYIYYFWSCNILTKKTTHIYQKKMWFQCWQQTFPLDSQRHCDWLKQNVSLPHRFDQAGCNEKANNNWFPHVLQYSSVTFTLCQGLSLLGLLQSEIGTGSLSLWIYKASLSSLFWPSGTFPTRITRLL